MGMLMHALHDGEREDGQWIDLKLHGILLLRIQPAAYDMIAEKALPLTLDTAIVQQSRSTRLTVLCILLPLSIEILLKSQSSRCNELWISITYLCSIQTWPGLHSIGKKFYHSNSKGPNIRCMGKFAEFKNFLWTPAKMQTRSQVRGCLFHGRQDY